MPFLAAFTKKKKKLIGMDKTSAHGHEMTRKTRERLNQSAHSPPNRNGGSNARSTAQATTNGV
jgi:hypothetical protein